MPQALRAPSKRRSLSIRSFRTGRVKGYLRGSVWYLSYHENGQRRRPRVSTERGAAHTLAAQINAQLETGTATALSFEPVSVADLRTRWLDHHEHVIRSSVNTINRYRAATDHLLRFIRDVRPMRTVAVFGASDAEAFVRYLRTTEVAPNGHANSAKRRLLDKGVWYILACCRTLFAFAAKRRHLPPYSENPFTVIEIGRIPIEDAKSVVLLTPDQERRFLEHCDDWEFPVFLTLMLTGMRPGELFHLLLPDDLDLERKILRVSNKPKLGWQVKTRSEREIPLCAGLAEVLTIAMAGRSGGPAFLRRGAIEPVEKTHAEVEALVCARERVQSRQLNRALTRHERLRLAKATWSAVGALDEDRLRQAFTKVLRRAGLPRHTTPKALRHLFATTLQDTNVDPLVRNLLNLKQA